MELTYLDKVIGCTIVNHVLILSVGTTHLLGTCYLGKIQDSFHFLAGVDKKVEFEYLSKDEILQIN